MRNCPVDCASIYYNGVRRSGLYTVVPTLAAMPVEVYCDMDTDGESRVQWGKRLETELNSFCIIHSSVSVLLLPPDLPHQPPRRRLDGDPAAPGRLGELRPQLEGLQGRLRRPALRVLAGQRPHPRTEQPGRVQPPHPPAGLEQQAQARPLPELQVTARTGERQFTGK